MPNELIERHVRPLVVEALSDSRAVCLLGARQVGKSTLAKQIAGEEHPAAYITLDNAETRLAAREDPTGFVAALDGPTVIDEVQRAPDLMLAIKARLDARSDRGQFLLTGSANILTLPTIADRLPGRVDYVRLWPFSQGELAKSRETFVDRAFAADPPLIEGARIGRDAYADQVATGGFPEAQGRGSRSRERFFASYVSSIWGRDIGDVARVRDVGGLERLLGLVAARSGSLASMRGIGSELGIDHKTAAAHVSILENLFLVARLKPWHVNLGSRQVKTPKLYMTDTGLLAHLINVDAARIARDASVAGSIFETFVAMELARQLDWSDVSPSLFHYRDKQQREVDIVMELRSGEIVGIEVKTAATVSRNDFAALRYLRDRLGSRFISGIVLYTGARTLPFGERLAAVPLCGLWQS